MENTAIQDLQNNQTTCGSFWNNHINNKISDVKTVMTEQMKAKHPEIDISKMAHSTMVLSGKEVTAAEAMTKMQNARLKIATSATLTKAIEKAGAGLTGIELSNSITAQQSLYDGMTDNTGQFKWMIRVIPVVEYLMFAILIFLGLPMAVVAGASGAQKGGHMLMSYASGLIAFNFIDVGLAIVQSVSMFYYQNKMASTVQMLGDSPFTATSMSLYMQEMAYMSGMMGLVAVITVPLVVSVVFKGETMAASAAFGAVTNKYQGDKGGTNAQTSLSTAASVHAAEAAAQEEYARQSLKSNFGGMTPPKGALASKVLEEIAAEAESYSVNMGAQRVARDHYGGTENYNRHRALSGQGQGMQKTVAGIESGQGVLDSINDDIDSLKNFGHQTRTDAMSGFKSMAHKGKLAQEEDSLVSRDNQIEAAKGSAELDMRKSVASGLGASKAFADGSGADFMHQTQTDSEAMIKSTAAKGKFSKDNEDYSRDKQISAAQVMANDSLVKSVQQAKGLVSSMAFNSDGTKGKKSEFDEYAKGTEINSRIQANKTMGDGQWADTKKGSF